MKGELISGSLWYESSHVRESTTALDSGFHPVDSGFQVFVSETWILDFNP